jgi:hypothetical protein
MRFLFGFIVGILVSEIGVHRIAQALQQFVDHVKSFV